ncbi:MAG: hypothetical protein EOM83_05635 [Clostridia bacterium]|nr:hypothetical protein [Clostridia bacterium]
MSKENPDKEEGLNKPSEPLSGNSSEEIIPEEILDAIPEEDRGRVAGIIRQTMIASVMKRSNPIAEKITPEHISQIIARSDDQDKRDRDERKGERNYNLLLVVIALLFTAFLIIFLQNNEDLLVKIVIGIISFIGGFGFGQSRQKK